MNKELDHLTVNELWNAFRKGNKKAFQYIYQLHIKDLLYYGRKITHDTPLIEDSIQDLFIELWQSRERLSETDSIRFYLFRALRYKIHHLQRKDPYYNTTTIEDENLYQDINLSIENLLIETEGRSQQLSMLKKCLESLSSRQQQAIYLRFFEHFSNEEIAQIMGVNYQSACKFIYSGLKSLREVVRILSLTLIMYFL